MTQEWGGVTIHHSSGTRGRSRPRNATAAQQQAASWQYIVYTPTPFDDPLYIVVSIALHTQPAPPVDRSADRPIL